MRLKTKAGLGIIMFAALLVLAFTYKNSDVPYAAPKISANRESRLYRGVEERPRYSRSSIGLTDSNYSFKPVLQGDSIEHDFFLLNTSPVPIEFSSMKSCCGILLTHYTPIILPGEQGKISILMLTDKFGGKTIQGSIRAVLKDHEKKEFTLTISAPVNKIASISQHKIIIKGPYTKTLSGETLIIPEPGNPFRVTGVKARKGLHINYRYSGVKKDGKQAYVIHVTNTQKKPGGYRDMLYVRTDHPDRPEIRIRVEGYIH